MKKERLTALDIIHNWCNQRFEKDKDYKVSNYSANNTNIYYNNQLIGTHLNGYVFIKQFDRTGAYGNGYSSQVLYNACPNKSKAFIYNEILTQEIIDDKDRFLRWYQKEFINKNQNTFELISLFKEFINNNSCYAIYQKLDTVDFDFIKLPKGIEKQYKKDIGNIKIEGKFSYLKYQGWSRSNYTKCETVTIDTTIKKLSKGIKQFFTKKELEHYTFKIWRNEYIREEVHSVVEHRWGKQYTTSHQFLLNIKQSLEVYNDLDKRKYWEEKQIERKKQRELREKEKERKAAAEILLKGINRINDWKIKQELSGNLNLYIGYQALKILADGRVQTSFGVTITAEEAKRAYSIWIRYKDKEDKEIQNLAIANFPVKGIFTEKFNIIENNEVKEIECKSLQVGCHNIPAFEIDDFINRYKLNW